MVLWMKSLIYKVIKQNIFNELQNMGYDSEQLIITNKLFFYFLTFY